MNELCVKLINAFFYSKLELSDGVTIFAILDSGRNLIMAMTTQFLYYAATSTAERYDLSNDGWSANFFLDRFP